MRSTRGVGLTNRKEGEREDLVVLALVFPGGGRTRYRPTDGLSFRCFTGEQMARASRIWSGSVVWKRGKDDTVSGKKSTHSSRIVSELSRTFPAVHERFASGIENH